MDEEKNAAKEVPTEASGKEIAERMEREGVRHVTPPGDPEFPTDEYILTPSSSGKATKPAETPVTVEATESAPVPEKDEQPAQKFAPETQANPELPVTAPEKTTPTSSSTAYEDRSSQPEKAPIKTKWNWGAFSFTLFFGVAHRAYLGLLILLGLIPWIGPIFALVWAIIFGFHGEKWALENPDNHYRDEEEFRKIMDGWNRAGLVGFIIGIVLAIVWIVLIVAFVIWAINLPDVHRQLFQDFGNNYPMN